MYTNPCNMGSMSEQEGKHTLERMASLKADTKSKSVAATGFLEAIRTGTFFDMWQNLNERKNALDQEALTIFNEFEAIDPVTPTTLELYLPKYILINEKIKAMYNLLNKISSDPNKYFEKYNTPELWEDFLNMTLIQAPEAAAEGARRMGLGLLSGAIPIVAFGLFAFWVYNKTK